MTRCAIVGAGAVVEDLHLPALRAMRGIEIAAVCELDPERARRFQRVSGARRVYRTLDELLGAETDLDFIDLATPAHTHYALTKQALNAGLHVVVEKPLALCAEEGAELDQLARSRQRKLCVLQNYRFRTPVRRAQRYVAEGGLGRLERMSIVCHWNHDIFAERRTWDWAEKATRLLLYEIAVHYVDLAVLFAGPLEAVVGVQSIRDPESGAVTGLSALLEHDSGIQTMLDLAFLAASRFARIDLFGSRSDVCIKLFPEAFAARRGTIHPLKEIRAEVRRTVDFAIESALDRLTSGVRRRALSHFLVLDGFVRSLRQPELEPPVPAASAVQTLHALDSLHDAIASPESRTVRSPEARLSLVQAG